METGNSEMAGSGEWWRYNIPVTTTPDVARGRLEAILSDRLFRFNPYRVSDRDLTECAERGRWSPFPAVTQMIVFHFRDIRYIPGERGLPCYEGLFYKVGDSNEEHHLGVRTLCRPLTHRATRTPVWTLIDGRHLVASNIRKLTGKSVFISHAVMCDMPDGRARQAYRMHRLIGHEAKRAATIRESMCAAKLAMLEQIMRYAALPEFLGNPCDTFDYETPLRRAMEMVRRYADSIPPKTHIIGLK